MGLKVKWWRPGVLVCLVLLTACGAGEVVTPFPTLTLIAVTATFTPEPALPTGTPTQSALINPVDVITPTTQPGSLAIPVDAQPFVQLAIDNLSDRLVVDSDAIELLQLETAVWTSIDLGCGDTNVPDLANLEINGYRVLLGHGGDRYEYHTDSDRRFRLCTGDRPLVGRMQELLIEADPLAANLALIAQTRLARELDLPTRRIQLIDVQPFVWVDSSLGCPLSGQNYTEVNVPGYRILLEAGDEQYIFHSDSTQLVACQPDNEVLPES